MKKLDRLVLINFIGPYILSFFVAEFVLIMQFLWKYIDELVGKGLSFWFLAKLVFYYAVTIIPMAVPITVLISSVMVYGNMAEKYEMTSFKSSGVSLIRIMRPGIIIALFTAGFSLVSSNYLKPKANLEFYKAFDNVRKQKPSLTIEEGIFNDDFRGFSIRVGKKHPDDRKIEDIMIYDNTNRSFLNLTKANKGEMYTTNNGKYFVMELQDGEQYRELLNSNPKKRNESSSFLRTQFKNWKKTFDMSEFEFTERNSGLARRKFDLFNSLQLWRGIDTMNNELVKISYRNKYAYGTPPFIDIDSTALKKIEQKEEDLNNKYYQNNPKKERAQIEKKKLKEESLNERVKDIKRPRISSNKVLPKESISKEPPEVKYMQENTNIDSVSSLAFILPEKIQSPIVFRALNVAQTVNEKIKAANNEKRIKNNLKRKYELRLHQMYSWALICLIFMFVGAPLGSIVRKGGYGFPLLIAIIFFMTFIVLMILGEKLNKSGSMNPELAAWLPCLVIGPISVILSYLALLDINLLSFSSLFSKLKLKFNKG